MAVVLPFLSFAARGRSLHDGMRAARNEAIAVGTNLFVRGDSVRLAAVKEGEKEIIDRFAARIERMADEIADANLAEVAAYGPLRDERFRDEVRAFSRQHLAAFVDALRAGTGPSPETLAATRERASWRARQLAPLAAQLHSYLIGQREITGQIGQAAGAGAASRGAALRLTARIFDYNIALMGAVTEAYIEVVQGDLAELDAARRSLADALLRITDARGEHVAQRARRAAGLGFDPDSAHPVLAATRDDPHDPASAQVPPGWPGPVPPRWLIPAIARAAGPDERRNFALARDQELIAVLSPSGIRAVLDRVVADLARTHRATLRAGVGPAFTGTAGFADSYQQARIAQRHATPARPVVAAPGDLRLLDDLPASHPHRPAQLLT